MPLPTNRQSQMSVHMGKSAAVDDNHQIDNIAFKRNVVAKVAAYTVKASESGTIFTDNGATTEIAFTLPAPADGLEFMFYVTQDTGLQVAAPTAGTLMTFNDAAANSVEITTTAKAIGGGIHAFSDGTSWFTLALGSINAEQPNTIVT